MRCAYWPQSGKLLIRFHSHPNVIAYKEAFCEDSTSSLCIVMEYAESGDLMAKINSYVKEKKHFTEEEIWGLVAQITSGLKALHDIKVLHRDLKVRIDTKISAQTCS